jgi:histidinol-phosphate aminotransferase
MTTPHLRDDLASMPAYKAGATPKAKTGVETFKVSANENPYAPIPAIVDAITKAAQSVQRYPDPASIRLRTKLANKYKVGIENIQVGTGSVAVLTQLIQASSTVGNEVIFAWRSFEAYPIITKVAGATPVMIPLTNSFEHDLDAMAKAVTSKTSCILLCSPNNPTGPAIKKDAFLKFINQIPETVLVVLDEAYTEFVRDELAVEGLRDAWGKKNVAILRTFSKAYGMAGLRVGFCIAQPHVIETLNKVALTFGVTNLAEEAGLAALDHETELMARINALVEERTRVVNELTKQGWKIPTADGNFIWMDLKEKAADFAAKCDEVGLSVRMFANDGVRVTIAEKTANDRLIETAQKFIN